MLKNGSNENDQKMEDSDYRHEMVSKRILHIVSLNHFVNDGSTYLISSLFPAVIVSFGFSEYEIGILVAVGYLVNLIFQPITGRYSERFEARKLLAFGIILIAAAMFLFMVANGFAAMLVAVLVLRFGSSFYHPVGISAVSRTYTGGKLDSSMGFQSAFGNLGIVSAFVLSAPVYLAIGWKGPFMIYAALEISTVVITLLAMRMPKENSNLKQSNEIQKVGKFSPGLPAFFVVSAFVTGGGYAIFGNFGNLLLFHDGFGLSLSNYTMAVWMVSAFVGAIMVGRMIRKISRLKLLVLAYSLAGLSSIGFGLSGHDFVIVILSLLVNGFMLSVTYPVMYSELAAFLGDRSKGAAFGVLFSSNIGGSSVLGFVGGYVGTMFGLQVIFEISSILLLCSIMPVFVWSRRKMV